MNVNYFNKQSLNQLWISTYITIFNKNTNWLKIFRLNVNSILHRYVDFFWYVSRKMKYNQ